MPILKKDQFKTYPDWKIIQKMNKADLEKVDNFCVFNEFGTLEFIGETDITFLNLDDIIEIKKNYINVYPDENIKPEKGTKLNKPTIITFNHCPLWEKSNGNIDHEKIKKKLKRKAKDVNV